MLKKKLEVRLWLTEDKNLFFRKKKIESFPHFLILSLDSNIIILFNF